MREWFELAYGEDSGFILYELSLLSEIAGDRLVCWSTLHYEESVDYEFISEHAEEIWEMCDRALALADSKASEIMIEKYVSGFRYLTLLGRYDVMYTNGTDEERAFITDIYRWVWDVHVKYHLPTSGGLESPGWQYMPAQFDPDVHPHTWLEDSPTV